jgi:hypothetical protein
MFKFFGFMSDSSDEFYYGILVDCSWALGPDTSNGITPDFGAS